MESGNFEMGVCGMKTEKLGGIYSAINVLQGIYSRTEPSSEAPVVKYMNESYRQGIRHCLDTIGKFCPELKEYMDVK